MRIPSAAVLAFGSLVTAGALAQPTGALPPVEEPPPPAAPETPPAEAAPAPPVEAAPAPAPTAAPAPAPPPGATAPPGYPQGTYYAPPPPAPPPPPPPPVRSFSLTMSPIHLILPVFELTAEVRPVDHLGIAAIGGYGSVTAQDSLDQTTRFDAYEVGGQVIWYPMHEFDGLEVGVEVLYINVNTDNVQGQDVKGVADGLAFGPMVGYKLVTSGGFTFVAQGGFEYVDYNAEASDTSGNSASDSRSDFIPLINLNIGWSF